MFIQRKPYLRDLNRMRVSEGRNLAEGLRLDRNEKVDVWPSGFLAKVFSEKPDYFLSVYPESGPLYKKLSKYLGVNEEQIMLTSGIDGAIKTLYEIMTQPGDVVAVLSPTYAMYNVYSNLYQVKLEEIGYKPDFSLDMEKLDAVLAKRPTMLFVPNPNQPIESSFSVKELDLLAEKAYKSGTLLIVDEAYYMFGAETAIPLLQKHQNVVVTRTFSKGFGVPSIRLGYFVSTPENMKTLSKTRFAHESNAICNAIAEYLLDHYDMVENYIGEVVEGRNFVKAELKKMGYSVHGNTGNYLLIDLQTVDKAKELVAFLREKYIYVKGPWQAPWDRYITITLGPKKLMHRFLDAVTEWKNKQTH